MHTLLALFVTVLTACAIAHPPVMREAPVDSMHDPHLIEPSNRKSIRDYLLPKYVMPRQQYKERIPYPRPQMPASEWLNKEIDRINRMQDHASLIPKKTELPRWMTHEPYKRIFGPVGPYGTRSHVAPYFEYPQHMTSKALMASTVPRKHPKALYKPLETTTKAENIKKIDVQSKDELVFALTPLDKGYFEPTEKDNTSHKSMPDTLEGPHEGGGHQVVEELGPRRQIRQNPNLSRTKTLVADDIDKLRAGLGTDSADTKDKPNHIHVLGSQFATGTIYVVGIAAGIGTAIILAILGFVFGWYALSKRAKEAADVDYPAYGVTGPTMDTSGDRKLAHSAQMYHYQHQKQQIIAMERSCAEQRNGSVSDPESEEENEEGDYTVYECPGFATTGDMEVKNPLFNEDPTPATPGTIAVVKPQPKE